MPGTPFFVGLLVIGSLCVACELRAFAATRHQRAQHDDAQDHDGQVGGGGSTVLWLGLLELVLAAVAAVGTVIGVVLVLVAVVGLGAHVIAG